MKNLRPQPNTFPLVMECQGEYNDNVPQGTGTPLLSKDTLDAFEELGLILRGVHRRMISEGYEIADGHVRKVKK